MTTTMITKDDFDAIDALFDARGYDVSSAAGEIALTRDTLADFRDAAKNWAEHGAIEQDDEDGFAYLLINRVQPRKGDQRRDVLAFALSDGWTAVMGATR